MSDFNAELDIAILLDMLARVTTVNDLQRFYVDVRLCRTLRQQPERSKHYADLIEKFVRDNHGPDALTDWNKLVEIEVEATRKRRAAIASILGKFPCCQDLSAAIQSDL